ncbi:MAG: hypothetical protein US25_C0026G0001 [Candidatus Moranbacteria bacterium GW2011_GWE1_36_7]|nr:MAG: hypothetical protein UR99_C0040G0001 [Candidatus Moranbacteria bacterium GW2011_GWD2_36_12]KKQ05213.1 MAG: hypothetical protein US16_C0036G0001 [Candidatus Moranbacteria bacterium GW2011_GWE2_36_40]KKQ14351.1 MAG: hypothetical protein US25_C0026G0001 [Candidatus Moranbacteria bacterium GW2011_GWE1_36_7]
MARKPTLQQWEGSGCAVIVTAGKHSTAIPKHVARTIGAFIQSIGALGVWKAKLDECLPGSGACPEIVLTGSGYDPITKCFTIAVHPKNEDNGGRARYRLFVSSEDNSKADEIAREFENKLSFEKKPRKENVPKILGNDLAALAFLLEQIRTGQENASLCEERFLSVDAIRIINEGMPSLHERHALNWLIKEGYLSIPSTEKRSIGKSFVVSISETARVLIDIKKPLIESEEVVQQEEDVLKPQDDAAKEEILQSVSLIDIKKAKDLLEKEILECERTTEFFANDISDIQKNIDNLVQSKKEKEEKYWSIQAEMDDLKKEVEQLDKTACIILRLLKKEE